MPEQAALRKIFMTGATGYLGSHLTPQLVGQGYHMRALVRDCSRGRLPHSCEAVIGDALDAKTYGNQIQPADTFIHLVGVSRPNPLKAEQFRKVDLASVKGAVEAALKAKIQHFVYVSVAHPAPVMQSYIKVRIECEKLIRESGLNATILRPWYILGPGHWWPYLMMPLYRIFEKFPPTTEASNRLGLVKLDQMICALKFVINTPVPGIRVLEVEQIRAYGD